MDNPLIPEQQKQVKKIQRTLWVGIFIIMFVGLLIAVYFVFVRSAGEQININTGVIANTAIDTSDWQTYSNAQYGFQFQYPKEWKLNESVNHCPYDELNGNCTNDIVILNPSAGVSVYVSHQSKNLEHLTIEEWLVQNQRKQYDEKYKIKTSEIGKITLSELTPGLYQGAVSIDFTEGDDVFEVEWYDADKNSEQEFLKFQQLVLSLEFSSSIALDTTSWQTIKYNSDYHNFSLEIPQDWELLEQSIHNKERIPLLTVFDQQGNQVESFTVSYYQKFSQKLSEWVTEHKQELIRSHEDIIESESDYTKSDRIVIAAEMKEIFKHMHCYVSSDDLIYEIYFFSEIDSWTSYKEIFERACNTIDAS